jgi:hypothetical protein
MGLGNDLSRVAILVVSGRDEGVSVCGWLLFMTCSGQRQEQVAQAPAGGITI